MKPISVASVLFFLSGASGLAYEVIWFKRFTHVWGSSTLAMAAVVASFLAGLGLGARFFGRRADAIGSPMRAYALCEAGVGVLALLVPYAASLMMGVAAKLYPTNVAVEFALTFAVIGPPAFLMGGTLPLMVRQFPGATGLLYGVNTVGAAIGCFATGFFLLPKLGLPATNDAMACTNLAVALAAFFLAKRLTTEPAPAAADAPAPERMLLAAAALAGAGSLVLEMVWARQLAVMLGSSTYAFTTTLFVVLAGLGLGSGVVYRWVKERPSSAADAILALMVGTLAGQALLLQFTYLSGLTGPLRASHAFNAAFCVTAGAVVQFIPALAMGALFPLIVDRTRGGARDVGAVYAWNTIGTIVGASATSLWVVPALGAAGAVKLSLMLYATVLLMLVPMRPWTHLAPRLAALAVIVGAAMLGAAKLDLMTLNSGMHHYGYRSADTIRRVWEKPLFLKEGASCSVMVVEEDRYRALYVNGKVDAATRGDMGTQLGLAYFPRLLHPAAKSVLVIGYGSGTTAGASLLFPGTRVTCCEIEPAVFEASWWFKEVNHRPDQSPNFTIVFEDGRRHVQGARESYDLIISEPSNPWIAGVGNLFTKEFYEAAQRRLAPGGVFAQWIQTYHLEPADYALIVRTMMNVFPHAILSMNLASHGDTILLASDRPLLPDRAAVEAAQGLIDARSEVRVDLSRYFGTTDAGALFLAHFLLDEAGLVRFLFSDGGTTLNTDANLRLEFDAPRRLFGFDRAKQVELVRGIAEAGVPWCLAGAAPAWGGGDERLKALKSLATLLMERKILAFAPQVVADGLALDRSDPFFLSADMAVRPSLTREALEASLPGILARSESDARRLGKTLTDAGLPDLGAVVFEQLVAAYPNSATGWAALSRCYRKLGQHDRAQEAFDKAAAIDPLNPAVESPED